MSTVIDLRGNSEWLNKAADAIRENNALRVRNNELEADNAHLAATLATRTRERDDAVARAATAETQVERADTFIRDLTACVSADETGGWRFGRGYLAGIVAGLLTVALGRALAFLVGA